MTYELPELFASLTERPISSYGYGGHVPDIPWQDVAYGLGIVGKYIPGAEHMLRIRYAHAYREEMGNPSFRDLLANLEYTTWGQAASFFWQGRNMKREASIRDFTRLAIAEHLSEHRCPSCQGIGRKLTSTGQWLQCQTCMATEQGEGRIKPNEEKRAAFLFPHIKDDKERLKHWWKWARSYRDISNLLAQNESSGLDLLRSALFDHELRIPRGMR